MICLVRPGAGAARVVSASRLVVDPVEVVGGWTGTCLGDWPPQSSDGEEHLQWFQDSTASGEIPPTS